MVSVYKINEGSSGSIFVTPSPPILIYIYLLGTTKLKEQSDRTPRVGFLPLRATVMLETCGSSSYYEWKKYSREIDLACFNFLSHSGHRRADLFCFPVTSEPHKDGDGWHALYTGLDINWKKDRCCQSLAGWSTNIDCKSKAEWCTRTSQAHFYTKESHFLSGRYLPYCTANGMIL